MVGKNILDKGPNTEEPCNAQGQRWGHMLLLLPVGHDGCWQAHATHLETRAKASAQMGGQGTRRMARWPRALG